MAPRPPISLHRRLLCTKTTTTTHNSDHRQWRTLKQVTKSNFSQSVEEIKTHISKSDFIAVSLQKTGAYSSPWQRPLPIDTAEIAYLKAKYAAERFQVLQFAVCPFSIQASKLIAHPYNFHLFPRDEMKMGMPSYSFSCQSSYLTSMAREGFDFNACIYDGISYLSRAQESAAKDRIGNSVSSSYVVQSPSTHSVADSIFIERTKSRVKHWIDACRDSNKKTEDALISTLRKLVAGSEVHGTRPCLNIDVCSERQVQLTLTMLEEFSDVVPLLMPTKGGGTQAVRVVLTNSKEDKHLLEKEIKKVEDEHNKRVRGFREVIDLISSSERPLVAHNSLNEFTFIHSKFLAPLPSTITEFECSLRLAFPHVLDVNHLMKEIGSLKNANNLPAAISYLKRKFFAPMDTEISYQAESDEVKIHGHNVLRISELFAKLCTILKIFPERTGDEGHMHSALESYANIFSACTTNSEDPVDEDVGVWTKNTRKTSAENLVFLWGFGRGMSARKLKKLLSGSHEVFLEEFDVRMVDTSCAIVVFWYPGFSGRFLELIDSESFCNGFLTNMISEGLRATGYRTYQRVCKLGLWGADLADSLEKALEKTEYLSETHSDELSVINWNSDEMINLDDL